MSRYVFLETNVWDAALERIRWLFDEFPNVYINYSGGKDSTVVLHLALQVAAERGRLPVNVLFLDQEAEWDSVITMVRAVMSDPRVRPFWLQIPFLLENSTNSAEEWLHVWDPAKAAEWIRPKEAGSIHENVYGVDKFGDIFSAFQRHHHPAEACVLIAGVRCEESPSRALGLTTYPTYKGETWGRKGNVRRGHYTFYPIYDWRTSDVWKSIHDNGWPYCSLYDAQYQYGIPTAQMRVSSFHHETAVRNLFYLQEIEPQTWERITRRLSGLNSAAQLRGDFFTPKDLPPMFDSWTEYRDHLTDHLILDAGNRDHFRAMFAQHDRMFTDPKILQQLTKVEIGALLVNDKLGTKLTAFVAAHCLAVAGRGKRSGRTQTTAGTSSRAKATTP